MGGTASAIKKQLKTGELVGGVDHIEKGNQRIKNLNNIIQKEQLKKRFENSNEID